ncbi:hypothetical protein [Psychrobacter vallis]|uniref:hypothetical protein n=1 Tax=Psychrobacter vallis TaxID=248451 RepID=UPI001917CF80|nr:hypothetical protein [Psychrobacter vallis]
MQLLKVVVAIILIFLTTKISLAYQFNQQVNEIINDPKNASQCIALSTKKFSYSDTMEK